MSPVILPIVCDRVSSGVMGMVLASYYRRILCWHDLWCGRRVQSRIWRSGLLHCNRLSTGLLATRPLLPLGLLRRSILGSVSMG